MTATARHITLPGMDETEEWCNSFILVPKPSGKVRLCLDPMRLNQELIRPVHRGPLLNDMFPKVNNAKCLSYRCKFWIFQIKARKEIITPHNVSIPFGQIQIQDCHLEQSSKGIFFKEKKMKNFIFTKGIWYCRWHFSCRM